MRLHIFRTFKHRWTALLPFICGAGWVHSRVTEYTRSPFDLEHHHNLDTYTLSTAHNVSEAVLLHLGLPGFDIRLHLTPQPPKTPNSIETSLFRIPSRTLRE